MSSTFSSARAAARRRSRCASRARTDRQPPAPPRPAAIATICCASTSSALRGTTVGSIAPSRMRRATTAHSSRSARNFGKMRPLQTSPTPCPARPIRCRPRRHRLRRLDLQDKIHRPHVDPQLQAGGRHDAGQLARLQLLLHQRALLARERAVVGAGDLRCRRLTRSAGLRAAASPSAACASPAASSLRRSASALGRAAIVDEHDRRAVLAHRAPAALGRSPARSSRAVGSPPGTGPAGGRRRARFSHRLDRHVDLAGQAACARRRRGSALASRAHQEARHLLRAGVCVADSPMRCAVAAAGVAHERVQALQRQRQVRAALGRRHRVDLIHDHPLDAAQNLPRARGQHQVQRLRRRDQDVGRRCAASAALALGRVAGADRHAHARDALRPDPPQRRAQVALDVVGERLQRRDVHQPRARARPPAGAPPSADRAPTGTPPASCPSPVGAETSTCSPAGDRRPRLRLGRRGLGEGGFEPFAYARAEGWAPICCRGGGGCRRHPQARLARAHGERAWAR